MATSTGSEVHPSTDFENMMAFRNGNNSKIGIVLEAVASEKHGVRYQDIAIAAGKSGVTAHELVAVFDMIRTDKLIETHKHPKGNLYLLSGAGRDRLKELRAPKDLPDFIGKDSPPDPDVIREHSRAPAVVHNIPIQRKENVVQPPVEEEEDEPEDDGNTDRITPCITPREDPVIQNVIQPDKADPTDAAWVGFYQRNPQAAPGEDDDEEEEEEEEPDAEPLAAETPAPPEDKPIRNLARGQCPHCERSFSAGLSQHEKTCEHNMGRTRNILRLLLAGNCQSEVAGSLGIDQAIVSQTVKQLLAEDKIALIGGSSYPKRYGAPEIAPEVSPDSEPEDPADEETIEQLEKDLAEKVEIELKEQEAKDQPFRVYGSGTCRHCEKFYARLSMHEPYCVKNPERIKPGQRKWPAAAPPKPAPVVSSPAIVPKAAPSSLPAASVCSGKPSVEQRIAALIKASIDGDAIPASFVLGDAGYDIRIEISRRAQR